MREHFVIGIVATRQGPVPFEAGDFIEDFSASPMRVNTRYCPFCGQRIEPGAPRTDTFSAILPKIL